MTTTIPKDTMQTIGNPEKRIYTPPKVVDVVEKQKLNTLVDEVVRKIAKAQHERIQITPSELLFLQNELVTKVDGSNLSEEELLNIFAMARSIINAANSKFERRTGNSRVISKETKLINLVVSILLMLFLISCAAQSNFEPTAEASTPFPPTRTALVETQSATNSSPTLTPSLTPSVPFTSTTETNTNPPDTDQVFELYKSNLVEHFGNTARVEWLLATNLIPNAEGGKHTNEPVFGTHLALELVTSTENQGFEYFVLTDAANEVVFSGNENFKPGDVLVYDNSESSSNYRIFTRPDGFDNAQFFMRNNSLDLVDNLHNVKNGGDVFWRQNNEVIGYRYNPETGVFEQLETQTILEHNLEDLSHLSTNILWEQQVIGESTSNLDSISVSPSPDVTYTYRIGSLPLVIGDEQFDLKLILNRNNFGFYIDPSTGQKVYVQMESPIKIEEEIFLPFTQLLQAKDTLYAVVTDSRTGNIEQLSYSEIEESTKIDGQTTIEVVQIFATAGSINELLNNTSGLSPEMSLEVLNPTFSQLILNETGIDGTGKTFNFAQLSTGKATIYQIIMIPEETLINDNRYPTDLVQRRWVGGLFALALSETDYLRLMNNGGNLLVYQPTPEESLIARRFSLGENEGTGTTIEAQTENDPMSFRITNTGNISSASSTN